MSDSMTAEQIDAILHRKHGTDPWVYFSQLRSKTGARAARTIDGYALHVWPSQFQAIAYEIKTSRSDFMAELDDPSKREPFVENSTQFYFVVPHGLVDSSEVPKDSGLMYAQSGESQARVVRKKAAPQRDIESFPPLFVASILREAGVEYKGADLFHLAGEDLTHEELEEYVDQAAEERYVDYEFRQERKEEAKEELLENGWGRYKEVYNWISAHRRALGISAFRVDAEDLQQWWNEIDGVEGDTTKKIIRKVERAEEKLDEIKTNLLNNA